MPPCYLDKSWWFRRSLSKKALTKSDISDKIEKYPAAPARVSGEGKGANDQALSHRTRLPSFSIPITQYYINNMLFHIISGLKRSWSRR